MAVWLVVALVLAASATAWTLMSGHVVHLGPTAAFRGYQVLVCLLVGAYWWTRRPGSRFGPLLVAFGVCWWVVSWSGSDVELPYTLGVIAQVPVFVLTFALCLSFPLGRLPTRLDRAAIGLAAFTGLLGLVPIPFQPSLTTAAVLSGCRPACPDNPFFVTSAPGLVDAIATARALLLVFCAAACLVLVTRRFREGRRPRRRALLIVIGGSLVLLPLLLGYQLSARLLDVAPGTLDDLQWPVVAARVLFPLGFLAALVQSELFAARALRQLLAELAARPSLARWRDAVASALDDPTLVIAYPSSRGLTTACGEAFEPAPGRLHVPIGRQGRMLAVIDGDPVLAEEPELVRATQEATTIAVENGHMDEELEAVLRRAADAGREGRERLARDLHDSTQQRLVALRVHLGMAERRLSHAAEAPEIMERLGRELDEALRDLRSLVRDELPPALADAGVGAALRVVVASAGLPVAVEDGTAVRYEPAVERTAYFCCLEAMQNAVKHAGPAVIVQVELSDDPHVLRFAVSDDGAGFSPDDEAARRGLAGIDVRVRELGGRWVLDSSPGAGTRIEGWLPAHPTG